MFAAGVGVVPLAGLAEAESREKTANGRWHGLLVVFQSVVIDQAHTTMLLKTEKVHMAGLHARLYRKLEAIREALGSVKMLDPDPRTFGRVFSAAWPRSKQLRCRFRAGVFAVIASHRLQTLWHRMVDQRLQVFRTAPDPFRVDEICCLSADTAGKTLPLREARKLLAPLMKLLLPDGAALGGNRFAPVATGGHSRGFTLPDKPIYATLIANMHQKIRIQQRPLEEKAHALLSDKVDLANKVTSLTQQCDTLLVGNRALVERCAQSDHACRLQADACRQIEEQAMLLAQEAQGKVDVEEVEQLREQIKALESQLGVSADLQATVDDQAATLQRQAYTLQQQADVVQSFRDTAEYLVCL